MGLSDDGDDPVTLAQTRCPCASVQGSDQAVVALVVSSGAGFEAQFDLVSVRASDLAGPGSAIESHDGSSAKRWLDARRGCQEAWCLIATMRPLWVVPGRPAALVLGS